MRKLLLLTLLAGLPAYAETPKDFQDGYAGEALQADPAHHGDPLVPPRA